KPRRPPKPPRPRHPAKRSIKRSWPFTTASSSAAAIPTSSPPSIATRKPAWSATAPRLPSASSRSARRTPCSLARAAAVYWSGKKTDHRLRNLTGSGRRIRIRGIGIHRIGISAIGPSRGLCFNRQGQGLRRFQGQRRYGLAENAFALQRRQASQVRIRSRDQGLFRKLGGYPAVEYDFSRITFQNPQPHPLGTHHIQRPGLPPNSLARDGHG